MSVGLSEQSKKILRDDFELIYDMRRYFSDGLDFEILRMLDNRRPGERIEEIRLRKERRLYLTVGSAGKKRNVVSDTVLSSEELNSVFERICDGSLYAYSESIIKGYVSLPSGIRVGVCGRAAVEGGRVFGVYDISALNIRIPHYGICVDNKLLEAVRKTLRLGQGVLIFAPPAQGKTTCLRSLAYELASGKEPMRVSAIDTRGEISFMPFNDKLSLDTLIGYPKAEGIRIATLFMNPEVIICDEIGGDDEARSIAEAQNCGVPLIASAHGTDLSSLMLKNGIFALHKACVFGAYVSLRIGFKDGFSYTWYGREEADAAFEDTGRARNNL